MLAISMQQHNKGSNSSGVARKSATSGSLKSLIDYCKKEKNNVGTIGYEGMLQSERDLVLFKELMDLIVAQQHDLFKLSLSNVKLTDAVLLDCMGGVLRAGRISNLVLCNNDLTNKIIPCLIDAAKTNVALKSISIGGNEECTDRDLLRLLDKTLYANRVMDCFRASMLPLMFYAKTNVIGNEAILLKIAECLFEKQASSA